MKQQTNPALPHSWRLVEWPADVYPGNYLKGRRVCRTYQDELIAEGAITRVGRELVVMGGAYARWMAKRTALVKNFDVPANRPEHVHKRGGRPNVCKTATVE